MEAPSGAFAGGVCFPCVSAAEPSTESRYSCRHVAGMPARLAPLVRDSRTCLGRWKKKGGRDETRAHTARVEQSVVGTCRRRGSRVEECRGGEEWPDGEHVGVAEHARLSGELAEMTFMQQTCSGGSGARARRSRSAPAAERSDVRGFEVGRLLRSELASGPGWTRLHRAASACYPQAIGSCSMRIAGSRADPLRAVGVGSVPGLEVGPVRLTVGPEGPFAPSSCRVSPGAVT